MAVVELSKCLIILMILYSLTILFGFLAAIPMILHVYPQSECLLFSTTDGAKLHYGHHATCNIVGYLFLGVVVGAVYLGFKCWTELRKIRGHHPHAVDELPEKIPSQIMTVHIVVMAMAFLLTIITTSGYVVACNNLHAGVSSNVQNKLNANPYDTRGEEIHTRYEYDYKFHRYTNRYGNAFGSEFYTIRITCRSILTDPEIHQRLHDSHYESQSRYYGYWYGTDLFAYDSQYEASKTNALVEAAMAGSWLCLVFWIGGLCLIIVQKYVIRQHKNEQDRISMHSTMLGSNYQGDGSVIGGGSQFRRDGSIISGKGSNFQRGGSGRGSDRSVRSSRRDVDDLALSNILKTPTQQRSSSAYNNGSTSYGRKDIDDMVLSNYISNSTPHVNNGYTTPSGGFDAGYISDAANNFNHMRTSAQAQQPQFSNSQPFLNSGGGGGFSRAYPGKPIKTTAEATYVSRDEVETEIF